MFLTIAAIDSSPQPTKSEKIFSYIKVGLPTSIGLVQQPVQIVVRYRSHNLTLFVRHLILLCPQLFLLGKMLPNSVIPKNLIAIN